MRIQLARPCIGKDELTAIQRVLESGFWTEAEVTRKFEKEFARYIGVKHAVATSSCTTALDLALFSLGLKQGDEVIVPDFTFPATGNSVFHTGAKPILVDIDIKTFTIDPDEIKRNITRRSKAIIPVHLFGQCANMKVINEIAQENDLHVVEDAACGIGSTHNGKKAGTLGDSACFSFHPRKTLAIGEGGMLVTNDDSLAERARILKNHGIDKKINSRLCFVTPGYNFRLNDIASAIGLVQLDKVDSFILERVQLAKEYNELFKGEKQITTPYVVKGNNHTYQTYCVRLAQKKARDKAISELAAKGIETQIGTYALHLQPFYRNCRGVVRSALSFSKSAYESTLALPFYNGLTLKEQKFVFENLMKSICSSG